jgi:hypothetical protein
LLVYVSYLAALYGGAKFFCRLLTTVFGNVTNVMLFFRSKGVATPLLRKNRKKKTLHLQHYPVFEFLRNSGIKKLSKNFKLAMKLF